MHARHLAGVRPACRAFPTGQVVPWAIWGISSRRSAPARQRWPRRGRMRRFDSCTSRMAQRDVRIHGRGAPRWNVARLDDARRAWVLPPWRDWRIGPILSVMISGRQRKAITFTVLGICLVAAAVTLNISWLVLNWREGVLIA